MKNEKQIVDDILVIFPWLSLNDKIIITNEGTNANPKVKISNAISINFPCLLKK